MPQYEWVCDQCTYNVIATLSMTEYDPKEKRSCPNCDIEVRRKIESVGISFGKGFFRDGYESANKVKTSTEDGE
jgi:putative FmdB family regulatory protein